ncbi:MAG: ATP-binding protein [Polyangiales bacterium]
MRHNRRALVVAALLILTFHPLFIALDRVVMSPEAQRIVLGVRAVSWALAALAVLARRTVFFERHAHLVTGALIATAGGSICVMTHYFGGLRSPYSNGLMLVMVGAGLVFLWPARVALTIHGTMVLGFVAINWPDLANVLDTRVIIPLSFVISTSLVVATGQEYTYRRERKTVGDQLRLELASERLREAADEIRRRERFKSRFFANITHDLKTPLAMILSPLELLIDGDHGPVTDGQRTTLRSIYRNGAQLLKLIGDLLDLSRIEEARLRLRIAEQDLSAFLRGLCAQCAPLVERKQIDLVFDGPETPVMVWVDGDRIERVFVNLIANAARFTPNQGRIEVGVRLDESRASVWVQDSGPGFPESDSQRIFERFYQSEQESPNVRPERGGTGIGLALAKELVDLHGGDIHATSKPGEGALFVVSLRLGREHFSDDVLERRTLEREVAAERRDSPLADFTRDISMRNDFRFLDLAKATERRVVERDEHERDHEHTVLVVEDTPDVARLVHITLHQTMRVIIASDGAQGLQLASKLRPDLIVTDLMMPVMDGLSLTRRVREDPELREIPIVMLTARGDLEDRLAGVDTGVNAYLTKPFSPRELLATVRANIRRTDQTVQAVMRSQMASLETVAGGLAHEINNPLNYIKQSLTLIERDLAALDAASEAQRGAARGRIESFLNTARSGVVRIGGTVSLMQRYAKEGYNRAPQPLDLFAMTRDVADVVGPATGAKGVLQLSLEGVGAIEGVADELQQVVSNLLQNAIEAAPEEGGRVVVRGRLDGDEVLLQVSDNGPGVSPENRRRVFRPFFTTKEAGKGTGMGLAIVWRVIAEHQGTITITESELGGACFTVRIPTAQGSRGSDRPRAEAGA